MAPCWPSSTTIAPSVPIDVASTATPPGVHVSPPAELNRCARAPVNRSAQAAKNPPAPESAGETTAGARSAEREEFAQRVLDAVGKLPETYRAVLTLRYLEGMEYEAMADILETPVPTLRSQIARGRQMIRRQLGP